MANYSADQIIACRRIAIEQNQKLFEEANALNRSALDLLDRSDFDSEMFLVYLQIQEKAKNRFKEALEHITLLNEHFPLPELQNTHGRKHSRVRVKDLINES
jgi:hypothetical protein